MGGDPRDAGRGQNGFCSSSHQVCILKMEIVAEKCIYIQCKTRLNSVFELYSSNEVNLGKSRSLGSS